MQSIGDFGQNDFRDWRLRPDGVKPLDLFINRSGES